MELRVRSERCRTRTRRGGTGRACGPTVCDNAPRAVCWVSRHEIPDLHPRLHSGSSPDSQRRPTQRQPPFGCPCIHPCIRPYPPTSVPQQAKLGTRAPYSFVRRYLVLRRREKASWIESNSRRSKREMNSMDTSTNDPLTMLHAPCVRASCVHASWLMAVTVGGGSTHTTCPAIHTTCPPTHTIWPATHTPSRPPTPTFPATHLHTIFPVLASRPAARELHR